MRALLLFTASIFSVFLPATVCAQGGVICLYADTDGSTCSLIDDAPGLVSVYVVHTQIAGATAAQFSAPRPACMVGATWVSDTVVYPVTVGDSQLGVSVGFGTCLSGPIHLLTINYSVAGTTLPDCAYPVLPTQDRDYVEIVDCTSKIVLANGGTTYVNSSLPCECDLTPIPPVLDVVPTSLVVGATQAQAQLFIDNTGGGTLSWSVSSMQTSMSFDPASGEGPATVTVTFDRTGLPDGVHLGTINVVSNGGNIDVPVTLYVVTGYPILQVTPTALDFGTASQTRTLTISNSGSPTLSWRITETLSWLNVLPVTGVGGKLVSVTVDRSGLSPGTYSGQIDVTSNGGAVMVDVSMTVPEPAAILSVVPTVLNFSSAVDSLNFGVSNIGSLDLLWSASPSDGWITVSPNAGTNDAIVGVRVDRTGLSPGDYSGEVAVTSNGGDATVTVNMTVLDLSPVLSVQPTFLDFGLGVESLELQIANYGVQDLTWSISPGEGWMVAEPAAGTNGATVTVTVDRTGLATGTYSGQLDVSSNGGNETVDVQMAVDTDPILDVRPDSLAFTASVTVGNFDIRNIGGGTLNWSIASNDPWIAVDAPLSGSGPGTATIHLNESQLPGFGPQQGSVTVSSNGGTIDVAVSYDSSEPLPSGGTLGIYADAQGFDCDIDDMAPGPLNVYIIHRGMAGATASQFSAPMPACMVGVSYLADDSPFGVVIGNSQTGVSVGYGQCLSPPVLVLTMSYYGLGQTTSCCLYQLLGHPDTNSPLVPLAVDCESNKTTAQGRFAVVNSVLSCYCGTVKTHNMTWGHIKSLYGAEDAAGGNR